MDENVAKAVCEVDLRFTSGNAVPVERASVRDHEWQTIRARLVELEAENERLDAECHLARKLAAMRGWRAEQAEALLRDIKGWDVNCALNAERDVLRPLFMLPGTLRQRITAHLSENAHG